MSKSRQWVVTVDLKATPNCRIPRYSGGQVMSGDVVAETDTATNAIAMASEYLSKEGFEVLDITQCEILIPRKIQREHQDQIAGIFTASNVARTSQDKVGLGTFIDDEFIANHPRPWILTVKVEALPSWTGERDDKDPIAICDALVYAVTEEGARIRVAEAMLEKHFKVLNYVRCEPFSEGESEPTFFRETFEWGEGEAESLSQHYDDFWKTKKLKLGSFIFPEDVIDYDSL